MAHGGESTRLPPMWPGVKSRRRRHMWVEFVVRFLLCSERFFSGYSGFPLQIFIIMFVIIIIIIIIRGTQRGYSSKPLKIALLNVV